jgi:hypothetical protein
VSCAQLHAVLRPLPVCAYINRALATESLRTSNSCRRHARAPVAIVHARKSGEYGQYSDYYSSDEARELSKIMPTDPSSLFDDSEWGLLKQGPACLDCAPLAFRAAVIDDTQART